MNVMMSCPAGDVFLGSIDTSGQQKNMRYIADELKVFIERVGPQYVTQVCTDNAANMLGAMTDITNTYPHIFKQGCMAHALDLMLEDWAKIADFRDLLERAKKVCQYIRNHHATMSTFRELSPNLQLLVPSETRFACNFLMLQRLVKLRGVLEQLKDHARVQNYISTLRNRQNGEQAATTARNVVRTIEDATFWQRCANYLHLTEPVLKALRVFDGKEPAMGRAWLAMHNLRDHVYKLRLPPYSVRDDIAVTCEESFEARWDMVFTDLHYAGALLNPYIKDQAALRTDGTAIRALNRVIRKMADNVGVRFDDVMLELQEFDEGTGPYSPNETPSIRDSNMLPHQWWHRVGDRALSKIAVRVLSLTCSASACERNFSMYSFVHNKSRNRLAPEKAESLVYIYTNARALRERPLPDPLRWYDANILSEDSDPDALGPVPVNEPNREFDVMRAEDEEEDDLEANHAPREYPPNPNIWARGADHLDEARNYYGNEDVVEEDGEEVGWGRWRNSPERMPSPPIRPNEAVVDSEDSNPSPDRGNHGTLGVNNNPSMDHSDGHGDDHNNGGGGVGMTESTGPVLSNDNVVDGPERLNPSQADIHDAFAFTEDNDNDLAPATATTVVGHQSTQTTRDEILTPSTDLVASEATPVTPNLSYGAVRGRPPTVPRRTIPHAMGQYQQGRGRTGSSGRSRGRNDAEASSSRPTRRPLIGIGARDPNRVIEPFLNTYVPGPTSSTPAFVVPTVLTPRSGVTGPAVNSDAEDPLAHRHKRFRRTRSNDRIELQLRNENSEVETVQASDGSDGDNEVDDADAPNCDEAPADDDVVIRDGIVGSRSTETVRRSSRFRN